MIEHLVNQIHLGDKKAENQIFQFLLVRFKILAKQRINEDVSEDIAQEACLTIVEKLRSNDIPENFMAWAYDILRKKIGNYYQYRDVRRIMTTSENATVNSQDNTQFDQINDLRNRLLSCMRKLIKHNQNQARILNLIYQGYNTDEISEKLSISPDNMYMILSRGRKMLRNCLGQERS